MKKFYSCMMYGVIGMVMSCMCLVLGFAESPEIAAGDMEVTYTSVWDAVMEEAEDVDLEILSEYMNQDLLAEVSVDGDVYGTLYRYCSYDTNFVTVLEDYFC